MVGGLGLGSSAGSRYKVTARCVPEVSITSPTEYPLYNTNSSHDSSATVIPTAVAVAAVTATATSVATNSSPPLQTHTSFSPVQYYSYPHTATNNINITTNNITNIPNNTNNSTTNTTTNNLTTTITANTRTTLGSTNNITTKIINKNNNNKNNNSNNNNNIKNLKNINKISQAKSISHPPTDSCSDTTNPINTISQSSGATLVEEEDFNELTAVPTTTIVIAATTGAPTKGNSKVAKHLAPLKLKQPTISQGGPCSTIAASVRNVLQRQQASTSPTSAQPKTKTRTPTTNITAQTFQDNSQPNEHTPLVASQTLASQQHSSYTGVEASVGATLIASPTAGINTSHQSNVLTTTAASTATTATAIAAAAAAPTAAATTTTYSHNSKTTRSWPVIYRNPHHYDYEALYANAASAKGSSQYTPLSSSFKQNCYSNQFKQSIVYSSSNEDLTTINECGADGVVAQGNGGRSSSSSLLGIGCGGGYNNSNPHASSSSGYNNKYNNNNSSNSSQQQQTTCYYFSPSRHNSIYEHPSAVVASSLQFDAQHSAATTAAAAAAVESIRRSNSILLRNSSCSSKIMHLQSSSGGGGNLDSPTTSLNSAMDVTSNVGASNCCSSCCMGPPPVLFLFVTLLMTTSATAMLCAAIMTDHWEHVKWDRTSLDRYSNRSHSSLEWIMEDKVAMLKPDKRADHRFRRDNLFLVPMHGGIWTLCIDLPLHEIQELRRHPKFPRSAPTCLNYLAGSTENARGEEQRNDWQHSESQTTLQPHLRMQNLSISCSLVCLIILGSAALVGAFGVCQRQISAILITGVMYLLAALFALFTLMIIHFKRQQGRPMLDSDYDGTVDGIVARPGGPAIMAKPLLGARIFLTSWSLDLGWGGVVLCAITSVLWILLSKIMRYNPFSTLMI